MLDLKLKIREQIDLVELSALLPFLEALDEERTQGIVTP
jgi:hypothetical protein